MTTIEAPRIAGRDRAREDVAALDLRPGGNLVVTFPARASATPSYLDELVAVVCVESGATLVLRSLSERARSVAAESADRQGVSDLLVLEP
jgi:hypothetical protein